jgi:hypothetical protein
MPFTPFHLGPGAAFKAVGGRHFSFMIFGGSQVLMDLEPLVRMVRSDAAVHGLSHTVLGAFGIGVVSAALGKPISEFVLRLFGARHASISWTVALASAFIGTYSHIALDAVMHGDMAPLWPLSDANPLLRAIRVRDLYLLCLISGIAGGAVIAARAWRSRKGVASK